MRKSKTKQHEKKPNEDKGKGVLNVVQKKRYCYTFNSDAGCQRSKCSFLHEKIPKSKTDKVFTCYNCGKKGHIAKHCRNKNDKKENKNGKDEKKEESSGENDTPGPVAFCFSSKPSQNWFFDSGATNHITNDYSDLTNVRQISPKTFTVANSSSLVVSAVGEVRLGDVLLTEVYYSRSLPFKLISENKLVIMGADISKDAKTIQVKVRHPARGVVMMGSIDNDLTKLTSVLFENSMVSISPTSRHESIVCHAVAFDLEKVTHFHNIMGHLNFSDCFKMLDMQPGPVPRCESCCTTKLVRHNIEKEAMTRASKPLFRVFADLSGRKRSSLAGYRYYLIIVDDYSRKRWVYWLKEKSEAYSKLVDFVVMVERQQPNFKIAFLNTDGGGEFISKQLKVFCNSLGITQNFSAPYCQFQNGVAERSVDIIDSSARAMLEHSGCETYDWPYAVNHSVFLRNNVRSGSLTSDSTPNELYFGVKRFDVPQGIFGCLSYAKVYVRGKQEPKASKVVFLGCDEKYKASIVRSVCSYRSSLREYYARDIRYDVTQFPYKNVLVPRPQAPPLDDYDRKELDELKESRQEEFNSGDVLDVKHNEDDAPISDSEEEMDYQDSSEDEDDDDNDDDDNEDEKDEEIDVENNIPDLPEHVQNRRNPSRGARDSSLKALEKFQAYNVSKTVGVGDPKTRKQALESSYREQWLA